MKRCLILIVLLSIIIVPCFADENIRVVLNGEELVFDAHPVIVNDRAMVPLRVIAESCGYNVTWNEINKRIGLGSGNIIINLYIGKSVIYVRDKDGSKEHFIDASPFIQDSRTFVPISFISEYMGYEVFWDKATRTVSINDTDLPITDAHKDLEH